MFPHAIPNSCIITLMMSNRIEYHEAYSYSCRTIDECYYGISSSSASTPSDYVRYPPSTVLKAGTPAPDFTLHTTPDQTVSLREFRDRPTILAFYPADFSPVCGDEMTLFNEILPEFEKFNAALMGLSVDGVWCHLAFSKD